MRYFVYISALCWLAVSVTHAVQFEEVHLAAGLARRTNEFVHHMQSVAWVDLDCDGDLDLWAGPHGTGTPSQKHPVIYWNDGDGTFTRAGNDVMFPDGYGNAGDKHELSFADFDNDGDPDVYWNNGGAAGAGHPTGRHLWRFDSNHFTRAESQYPGIAELVGSGRGALWFDWDRDGLLDLVSINAIVDTESGANSSQLLHCTGTSFIDRTEYAGFNVTGSANFAVYSDLFGDDVPDVVMLGGERKVTGPLQLGLLARVFRHTSTNLVEITNCFPFIEHGKDAAIADLNGDCVPDVFCVVMEQAFRSYTNWAEIPQNYRDRFSYAPVYLECDPASNAYVDRTLQAGVTNENYGKSVLAGDFDNDMDIDLWVYQQIENIYRPAIFYENSGSGTFVEVAGANGANYAMQHETLVKPDQTHGAAGAVGDYNNDGFLDIYMALVPSVDGTTNIANIGIPPQLFRNLGNSNHWLELDLVGVESPRDPIGAKALVTAGGKTQLREQNSGNHRVGQDMKRLHFGLGPNDEVDRVEIRWPLGQMTEARCIAPDQILELEEQGSPAILRQPTNSMFQVGMPGRLCVGAYGAMGLAFQWENASGALGGATNPALLFNPAGFGDSGDYRVIVSNNSGAATSEWATVVVVPEPAAAALAFAIAAVIRARKALS